LLQQLKIKFRKNKKWQSSNSEKIEVEFEELDDRPFSFPSLVDNMLNDGVHFEKDHFILQTGLGNIKYGRSFFIKPSGYPRTVRIGWLEGFFSGDDLDVAVHIDPLERHSAIKKLQEKIDELDTVIYAATKRDDQGKYEDALQKKNDTKILQNQIKNNMNGLYFVSIQATIFANSFEELNEKCVALEGIVGGESIELVNAYGRQKEGFLSTLPTGKNYLVKSTRNLDQRSLTAIFPHSSSKLNHTGGMPIGRYGREYVYFNQFDRRLNNYSMGIFGESGAGKGVFGKTIIGRGPMDGISRHIILDVEPEYGGLTEALGGIVIPIRADKDDANNNRINPFDIYPEKEVMNKGKEDEYVVERINLNEKIKELIEFFKVMKESCTPEFKGLTPIEMGILNEILERLYKDRGITEDPESIYRMVESIDGKGKIVFQRQYIEMPTISEAYRELEKERENGYDELKEMCNVVRLFTKGRAFGMFDGQTKINTENGVSLENAPIITFDISKLSANGIERPLAQHVIMTYVWNRFIVGDPKSKKRVIVDEAWMLLKFKAMMEFLLLLAARGRKWNVSLTLVSQRYEMFHRTPEARDVIAQLNTVCFMKQSDEDIEPILETFKFSHEVGEMIRTAETGDVIMKAGKEIVAFRSEPTPDEWVYLNTNQNIDVQKPKSTRVDEIHFLEAPIEVPNEEDVLIS
jgi:type IV secretory pathway VirB4 component